MTPTDSPCALYFDYNATTPVAERVFAAMRPYLTGRFGNPGCGHGHGVVARQAVARARAQVAALVNMPEEAVVFTSGATEANHLAILGCYGGTASCEAGHFVTTTIEHPAVHGPARILAGRGVEVAYAVCDHRGVVAPESLAQAATPRTKLISLMLANNETGVLQPVAEAGRLAASEGYLLHTDASQAVGKLPVDMTALGADLLTIAGHKLYAPKGVGALVVRPGVRLTPLYRGGGQEGALRPGTENVPHVVALGEACAMAAEDVDREAARQRDLGERLRAGLGALGREHVVHGEGARRLPNTLSVGFKDANAGALVTALAERGVCVTAGAACHGDDVSLSAVLTAMAVDPAYARGTVRFSWGRETTTADVDALLARLATVMASSA